MEMWPPTPIPGRWARCTMIAAFQRMRRRKLRSVPRRRGTRLVLGGNGVDVVGRGQRRDGDVPFTGPFKGGGASEYPGTGGAGGVDEAVGEPIHSDVSSDRCRAGRRPRPRG